MIDPGDIADKFIEKINNNIIKTYDMYIISTIWSTLRSGKIIVVQGCRDYILGYIVKNMNGM